MVTEELQKAFSEYLTKCDEAYLEYEEKHSDACGAYSHCVMWDRQSKDKLEEYAREQFPGITDEQVEYLRDAFDSWSFDMEPGHRFTTIPAEQGCCVASYAIEEVENQHEVKVIAEALDCEVEDVRKMVRNEKDLGSHCIGTLSTFYTFDTFETYQCTDACWFAVVPRSWFVETLEQYEEELE
jgi:hypothetical protein